MQQHTAGTARAQHQLEEALQVLSAVVGDKLTRQIKPILLANMDRGRLQYYVDGGNRSVDSYVEMVADTFSRLNSYLHQLQIERNLDVLNPLFERMRTWAYNFFLRKSFSADETTQDIASECASNAALTLLNAYFPYDTEFDAWAHIIVQNACRKYIANAFRKSVVPDKQRVELSEELVAPNDVLLEMHALRKEDRAELEQALHQLSEARRIVIRCIYFDEMTPDEIAQKMGKSMGAIYSLQFNALQDLRKILSRIRDNLNE